jgi:polar amino acid transport system substrate-binding protein
MFKRVGPLVAMGVLIVGLGWVLFWLVFSAHGPRDAWDRVRETGVLRIGYAVEAPYAFVAPSLEVTGESPETARLVANEIGVRHIEWVQVSFANLIPELLDGRFDLIAAGLFMTEDRLRQVSFSLPTLQVGPGVLMRADHEQELDAPLSWLLTSRGRIAVLEGAVEASRLVALGVAPQRLWPVATARMGVDAVAQGMADALVLSWPTTLAVAASTPGGALRAVKLQPPDASGVEVEQDQVAFAFHPRQQRLREAWDQALRRVRGSTGHIEVLQTFGFDAGDVPGEAL